MNYLTTIKKSFLKSLETHPRSNEKLKILHGFIASSVQKKLGNEYSIDSLGYGRGKESKINGRYMDKTVDIVIRKSGKVIAGMGVKFVMSNYAQNSVNYFENMLGETANIRTNSIPYFQIFIVPETLPYYKDGGNIANWEHITQNNVDKYIKMSYDNIDYFYHTPNKMLFTIVDFGEFRGERPSNANEYRNYFRNNEFEVKYSYLNIKFNDQTIYNNYELFLDKVYHSILSL